MKSARVVKQPGDGSCLFHSLSYGLGGTKHSRLREDIAGYIARNPTDEIGGTPIKDWVMWDSEMDCDSYAASMSAGNKWGGAIEIAVCAKVSGRDVLVYERGGGWYTCISKFEKGGEGRDEGGCIKLLYGGRCHYDAIE